MEVEHTVKAIPIDANFQSELSKIQEDGWQLVPTIIPVAIYHLVRVKTVVGGMIKSTMQIDDSKVMIIPAGQKTQ